MMQRQERHITAIAGHCGVFTTEDRALEVAGDDLDHVGVQIDRHDAVTGEAFTIAPIDGAGGEHHGAALRGDVHRVDVAVGLQARRGHQPLVADVGAGYARQASQCAGGGDEKNRATAMGNVHGNLG